MTELFVILVATVLVNNFVLVRFLGLCPFMGVSRNLEAAAYRPQQPTCCTHTSWYRWNSNT
jgi:Na+-translocating ferredoxin:NAD+ oxidoreductase RnfA subunit